MLNRPINGKPKTADRLLVKKRKDQNHLKGHSLVRVSTQAMSRLPSTAFFGFQFHLIDDAAHAGYATGNFHEG
jgi:hypothetical protein